LGRKVGEEVPEEQSLQSSRWYN